MPEGPPSSPPEGTPILPDTESSTPAQPEEIVEGEILKISSVDDVGRWLISRYKEDPSGLHNDFGTRAGQYHRFIKSQENSIRQEAINATKGLLGRMGEVQVGQKELSDKDRKVIGSLITVVNNQADLDWFKSGKGGSSEDTIKKFMWSLDRHVDGLVVRDEFNLGLREAMAQNLWRLGSDPQQCNDVQLKKYGFEDPQMARIMMVELSRQLNQGTPRFIEVVEKQEVKEVKPVTVKDRLQAVLLSTRGFEASGSKEVFERIKRNLGQVDEAQLRKITGESQVVEQAINSILSAGNVTLARAWKDSERDIVAARALDMYGKLLTRPLEQKARADEELSIDEQYFYQLGRVLSLKARTERLKEQIGESYQKEEQAKIGHPKEIVRDFGIALDKMVARDDMPEKVQVEFLKAGVMLELWQGQNFERRVERKGQLMDVLDGQRLQQEAMNKLMEIDPANPETTGQQFEKRQRLLRELAIGDVPSRYRVKASEFLRQLDRGEARSADWKKYIERIDGSLEINQAEEPLMDAYLAHLSDDLQFAGKSRSQHDKAVLDGMKAAYFDPIQKLVDNKVEWVWDAFGKKGNWLLNKFRLKDKQYSSPRLQHEALLEAYLPVAREGVARAAWQATGEELLPEEGDKHGQAQYYINRAVLVGMADRMDWLVYQGKSVGTTTNFKRGKK